jgi:hypothetical protein
MFYWLHYCQNCGYEQSAASSFMCATYDTNRGNFGSIPPADNMLGPTPLYYSQLWPQRLRNTWKLWKYTTHPYSAWSHALVLQPMLAPPTETTRGNFGSIPPTQLCLVPRPCTTANVGPTYWDNAWKLWKYTTHPYSAWSHALVLRGCGMGPWVWNVLNSPLLFIRWGASQVQFSFAAMSQFDWPNTPKNETVVSPNIEGSNLKYRDPSLWPPYVI